MAPIPSTSPLRRRDGSGAELKIANLRLDDPALMTAILDMDGDPSSHNTGATVDINCVASKSLRKRRGEIGACPTNVHDIDQLAERRLARCFVQHQVEVLQAGSRAGLQRSGRNRVDANASWAEFICEIAACRFRARPSPAP